jgi:hypothetical protein
MTMCTSLKAQPDGTPFDPCVRKHYDSAAGWLA